MAKALKNHNDVIKKQKELATIHSNLAVKEIKISLGTRVVTTIENGSPEFILEKYSVNLAYISMLHLDEKSVNQLIAKCILLNAISIRRFFNFTNEPFINEINSFNTSSLSKHFRHVITESENISSYSYDKKFKIISELLEETIKLLTSRKNDFSAKDKSYAEDTLVHLHFTKQNLEKNLAQILKSSSNKTTIKEA